ncbi:MAG TPA: hypothetical protein VNE82_21695 [Candidatus Binataceae bacterium]|nr:hypothetical protein [Candidatus Binataceae bacterium]
MSPTLEIRLEQSLHVISERFACSQDCPQVVPTGSAHVLPLVGGARDLIDVSAEAAEFRHTPFKGQ